MLYLVRHGLSDWNGQNRFTGWTDITLAPKGRKEALTCAKKLRDVSFDVMFTNQLMRCVETLLIIISKNKVEERVVFQHGGKLGKLGKHVHKWKEVPVFTSEELNERHYGDLQGLNKNVIVRKFGAKKVHSWRRGWDVRPPGGESLKDTYERTVPYLKKEILPLIRQGKNVLVVASGNSLRSIRMYLDKLSEDQVVELEIPHAVPIRYNYNKKKRTYYVV